ncbi:urease accessory protein UreE [Corynebacterium stationis]|uniref:urease accessory protein UreE n=1 Tax=Corynebacterium stationis TaxID=1705 RepID=UPI00076F8E19|nr:urease accessory protein UreE [Corynebacterium stationis]AMJ45524.1 Urease accessory protein UreE [Corynebacterium stationis]AQX71978.1 Urease accessory protein UreE [Corynebacterium stationis]ASJ19657.1 Urease accessory protein UreE [Corynebacterium stationis]HJG63718.1 urease accessory protein UreE [Corynebacterium stationis]
MIIENITSNIAELNDANLEGLTIDEVFFDDESRLKRIQRVKAESGEELALRLPTGFRELKDGDILQQTAEKIFVAKTKPTDVLVIAPRSIQEALVVAHTLGNRHLQAQFFDAESQFGAEVMVVRYDHTVEHHLEHAGAPYSRGEYVMPEAFRHAEHTH